VRVIGTDAFDVPQGQTLLETQPPYARTDGFTAVHDLSPGSLSLSRNGWIIIPRRENGKSS